MGARTRLLVTGQLVKTAFGTLSLLVGLAIVSGTDKNIETSLVNASPQWLIDLTTRF
jgi:cytochrome c-type biogenesis protein